MKPPLAPSVTGLEEDACGGYGRLGGEPERFARRRGPRVPRAYPALSAASALVRAWPPAWGAPSPEAMRLRRLVLM